MLLDQSGFAIPAADVLADELTEFGANDPDFGDPADWPATTDEDVWELGPAFPEGAAFWPDDEDWQYHYEMSERFAYENDLPL